MRRPRDDRIDTAEIGTDAAFSNDICACVMHWDDGWTHLFFITPVNCNVNVHLMQLGATRMRRRICTYMLRVGRSRCQVIMRGLSDPLEGLFVTISQSLASRFVSSPLGWPSRSGAPRISGRPFLLLQLHMQCVGLHAFAHTHEGSTCEARHGRL